MNQSTRVAKVAEITDRSESKMSNAEVQLPRESRKALVDLLDERIAQSALEQSIRREKIKD